MTQASQSDLLVLYIGLAVGLLIVLWNLRALEDKVDVLSAQVATLQV